MSERTPSPTGDTMMMALARHCFAADQLGVASHLPKDDLIPAVLQKIEEMNFTLDREQDLAARMLCLSGTVESLEESDDGLLQQIDRKETRRQLRELQSRFFEVPVRQRVRELARLRQPCQQLPQLLSQYQNLVQLQYVDPGLFDDAEPAVRELGVIVLKMAVSPPAKQGELFRKEIQPMLEERSTWGPVARKLNTSHREIADLCGDWFERILLREFPKRSSSGADLHTTPQRGGGVDSTDRSDENVYSPEFSRFMAWLIGAYVVLFVGSILWIWVEFEVLPKFRGR